MRIKMKNKRFPDGEANVLPDDVPTWEAAGWKATQKPRKQSKSKKDDDQ